MSRLKRTLTLIIYLIVVFISLLHNCVTPRKVNMLKLYLLLLVLVNQVTSMHWNIYGRGWRELLQLQDNICGFTVGYKDEDYTRGSGWFCVPSSNCSGRPDSLTLFSEVQFNYTCDNLRYNDGSDTCCHMGKLSPPLHVLKNDYIVFNYIKDSSEEGDQTVLAASEFKTNLYDEFSTPDREDVLNTHEICGLIPTGKREYTTLYQPYVCIENASCHEKHIIFAPIRYGPSGDKLCERALDQNKNVCCHISASVDEEKKQDSWSYKEFKPDQKYVTGFKANIMCEQYNRLVCEGRLDRCTLRVFKRDMSTPGEFPHQALVGVFSHRVQFFHCAGSLVSKNFILSAYDCRTFDGLLSNIVLLGDYYLSHYNEFFSNERVTYIKKHYTEKESHSFLLLRLWRPLKLNHYLRPACLNFYIYSSGGKKIHATHTDFGLGYLTGYGPIRNVDTFNSTLKRYQFEHHLRNPLSECRLTDKSLNLSATHLCLDNATSFLTYDYINPVKGASGFFDLGAPFSLPQPYCSWAVYGVTMQNPKYSSLPPTLVEIVPPAFEWIENIVWKDDFDLLELNMSLPDCADPTNPDFQQYRGFNYLKTLKREYLQWYMHSY